MTDDADLAYLQQWMQRAVLDREWPARDVERYLTASSRQTARQRLGVYRLGYRLRLLEAMRGLYPILCHLLGRELFDRFALDYLDGYPSRSASLFSLGARFPGHLARSRPDAGLRGPDRELWPDLVVDLAAFERTADEVLDAPEATQSPGQADLAPVPCLRLMAVRFPVHEYAAAVHRGQDPPPPAPRPAFLALARRHHRVVARELGIPAYRALLAVTKGAAAAVALRDIDPAMRAAWLHDWARTGLVTMPPHVPAHPHSHPTSTQEGPRR